MEIQEEEEEIIIDLETEKVVKVKVGKTNTKFLVSFLR